MAIDTNLFINAIIKGREYGNNSPTLFSQIVSGFEEEQKNAQQRAQTQAMEQQNVIRQNEINMLPVQNRIDIARADTADASLTAMRNDPFTFALLAKQEQDNKLAEAQREMQLDQQQQKLDEIMKFGSSAAKLNAAIGGQFADLYGARPNIYKSVEVAMSGLDPKDQATFFSTKQKERTKEYYDSLQGQIEKNYGKAQMEFEADTAITNLASVIPNANGSLGIDKASLLSRVNIRKEYTRPLVLMEETAEDGTVTSKMVPSTGVKPPDEKPQQSYTVYLDNKPFMYGFDKESADHFTNHKYMYSNKYGLNPNQGGLYDIENKGKENTRNRELQESLQKTAEQQDAAARSENTSKYLASIGVTNDAIRAPFRGAADAARQEIASNRASRMPQATPQSTMLQGGLPSGPAMPRPDATVAPARTIAPTATPTATASIVPGTPTLTATPEPTLTPITVATGAARSPMLRPETTVAPPSGMREALQATPTSIPAMANAQPTNDPRAAAIPSSAPTAANTPTASPTPTTDRAMLQAKANAAIQRRMQQPGAAPSISPVAQSAFATQSPSIPPTMTLNSRALPAAREPSSIVIDRINSTPEWTDMSAISKAIIAAESAGGARTVPPGSSERGARGPAQFTLGTANDIMPGMGRNDPAQAGFFSMVKFNSDLARTKNPVAALFAYNAGTGAANAFIRAAGSTDIERIKAVIPDVVRRNAANTDPKLRWYGMSNGPKLEAKIQEILDYPDRVLSYFPSFASTENDRVLAEQLKNAGAYL